ncbi:MAG: peptide ABC transporter substrate-binding protein [Gemmatimonadales bacterium]
MGPQPTIANAPYGAPAIAPAAMESTELSFRHPNDNTLPIGTGDLCIAAIRRDVGMPVVTSNAGRTRRELRRSMLTVIVGLCALSAATCGRSGDRRDSTVIVAYPYEGGGDLLGPSDDEAMFLVFLPLLRYDEHGNLEGRLASSWEHSDDYREWTYHLRTDVRWQDGAPVTAHDVAYTLELLSLPTSMEMWSGIIQSITVHDDSTITVRAGNPEYYQTQVVHYPRHLLQHLDQSEMLDWAFWLEPVGNGPYRFVRYVPHTLMEFEVNPDYVFEAPRIRRVILKFAGDAGLSELLSGNVDVVKWLDDPGQVRRLSDNPGFAIHYSFWEQRSRAIYWRCDHPILGDVRVRRAIDLALDRRGMLQALGLPNSIPAGSGFYSARQARRGGAPKDAAYDPQAAGSLLEQSGWVDSDGDGIRGRNGQRLSFTALLNASERYDNSIAIHVQDQLRQLGVDMQLQPLDGGALFERYKNGDFEAAVFQVWLQERFYEDDTPLGYHNPRLAELINRVNLSSDPTEVDRAYQEVTQLFHTDVPITLLFPITHTMVAHRRVRGLSSPWRSEPVWHMEDLWLEQQ